MGALIQGPPFVLQEMSFNATAIAHPETSHHGFMIGEGFGPGCCLESTSCARIAKWLATMCRILGTVKIKSSGAKMASPQVGSGLIFTFLLMKNTQRFSGS